MVPTVTSRAVVVVTVVIAAIGAVDAVIGEVWDLVAVFAIVGVLQLLLLARMSFRRPELSIRADLARWLRDRAATEGDMPELIVDRALAAYRANLLDAGGSGCDDEDRH